VQVRRATTSDVLAMSEIYAHHVLNGTGSFEEEAPTRSMMAQRFAAREADNHPTLMAILEGEVVGFAYAGHYKPRSAYRFTVENSIYVAAHATGQGIGVRLLSELIELCTAMGYRQMIAVIGDSQNSASMALHARCGFSTVGTAENLGYKHGRWLDIVYMQRTLSTTS